MEALNADLQRVAFGFLRRTSGSYNEKSFRLTSSPSSLSSSASSHPHLITLTLVLTFIDDLSCAVTFVQKEFDGTEIARSKLQCSPMKSERPGLSVGLLFTGSDLVQAAKAVTGLLGNEGTYHEISICVSCAGSDLEVLDDPFSAVFKPGGTGPGKEWLWGQDFESLDTDSTGVISWRNLEQACQRSGGAEDDEELQQLMSMWDMDGDGVWSFEEWQAAKKAASGLRYEYHPPRRGCVRRGMQTEHPKLTADGQLVVYVTATSKPRPLPSGARVYAYLQTNTNDIRNNYKVCESWSVKVLRVHEGLGQFELGSKQYPKEIRDYFMQKSEVGEVQKALASVMTAAEAVRDAIETVEPTSKHSVGRAVFTHDTVTLKGMTMLGGQWTDTVFERRYMAGEEP